MASIGGPASTPEATAAVAQSRDESPPDDTEGPPAGRGIEGVHFMIGPRVGRAVDQHTYDRQPGDPVYRPLQIYALDPSASVQDGATAVVNVAYEPVTREPRGISGHVLEVTEDARERGDPPAVVDLDDRLVLMRRGLPPSPEDPRFRQQMCYAVCSTTYAAFRHALGREVSWGFRREGNSGARLRIVPCVHGLRNAFYDPQRGEIRFGTFTAGDVVAGRNVPRGDISLALSHDVVVHEMSHALLDGMRSHFLHPSNVDVLAFHEGFADLVAIFQRFTYRDIVVAAIRQSRGNLSGARLLTGIALQFAEAMNVAGPLRSAIGDADLRLEQAREPHQRGALLVAAVFEAFAAIFERRSASLLRLSTQGTGQLPPGAIPDLLAEQLTDRAIGLASQFLSICIRAIDYCPPVDITFGEFLRAVITADVDLVPDDRWAYREAWVDAFARRRIYPADVPSLSMGALAWSRPEPDLPRNARLSFGRLRFDGDPGRAAGLPELMRQARAFGHLATDPAHCAEFGLALPGDPRLGGDHVELPVVESIRSSRRVGPSGQVVFDLVAEITQLRAVRPLGRAPGFDFFGGATVILDPFGKVRYVVRKSILDDARIERQRAYVQAEGAAFFGPGLEGRVLPQPELLLGLHDIARPQLRASVGTRDLLRGVEEGAAVSAARGFLMRRGADEAWVPLLKACLARCLAPSPALDTSTRFDADTEAAVSRLQREQGASVDGIVGPATWAIIGQVLRTQHAKDPALTATPLVPDDTPAWIRNLLTLDPAAAWPRRINVPLALQMVEFGDGALSVSRRQGLSSLLASIAGDAAITDLRWAAYMLATVKHECADTWQPIEEFGRGAGRPYGVPQVVHAADGRVATNVYYGRGYVQLTWKSNYELVGPKIGLAPDDLLMNPERALEPDVAYRVMSLGMRTGLFTGRTLGACIHDRTVDYVAARRIINGSDHAEFIASYARRFETMLLAVA